MCYLKIIVKNVCNVLECIGKVYFIFKKFWNKIFKLGVVIRNKKNLVVVEYNIMCWDKLLLIVFVVDRSW